MVDCLAALRIFCRVNAFGCMVLCYALYMLLGALVFMTIEMPVERTLRAEAGELRRAFLQENPCIQANRLDELIGKALATDKRDVAVLKANSEERHYDFTSSLYFVIVTLTTTGYDLFTPISEKAKLFCIFYFSLGIPLTLFLFSCFSDLLLPIVTHAPVHHLFTHWGLPYARAALVHASLLWAVIVAVLLLLPAIIFYFLEPEWSFLDALFFCFVTLSTIGQGGYSLGRTWGQAARETLKLLTTCYLMVGLVVIMTFRDTALEVPQVQAVMRLFSGPWEGELKGVHLDELVLSGWNAGDELRYSLPISTISPCPIEPALPSPAQPAPPDLPPALASSHAPTITSASNTPDPDTDLSSKRPRLPSTTFNS